MLAGPDTGTRRARALGGALVALSLAPGLVPSGWSAPAPKTPGTNGVTVIVVVGAAGEEEFGRQFAAWAGRWERASGAAGARLVSIGLSTNAAGSDRGQLEAALGREPKDGGAELWLVLLGHGTFDGKEAKFNLRGPDVSASDLAGWLEPFRRPLAVIAASSCSAPFLTKLSRPGRVVVTATRSGHEQSFARFGGYFSEAISAPEADLDKDGQVSLLEAFLTAAARVAEFYETEGRLATEHALLDDNGDGLGTPAPWFRGVRAVKKPKEGGVPDGLRAHQLHLIRSEAERRLPPATRARRDELELAVAKLRESKARMPEDDYYRSLEALLLELARMAEQAEQAGR